VETTGAVLGASYSSRMPRRPRVVDPHGLVHVTARGNRREPIYEDGLDYSAFLGLLAKVAHARGWCCQAFCLLPNHYHAVLETPRADLSSGMQHLNSRYAEWFNGRHELTGHVFQGRFHSVQVESDWHLLQLSRYVSMNPVRAGLCRDPAAWPWSSYRAVLGLTSPPPFLAVERVLRLFGREPARARASFHSFVVAP
jgi:putative transposase